MPLLYNELVLKNKLFLRILLNSLLGLVLVVIWSRFIDLSQVWQILKTVDFRFMVTFFGLIFMAGVLRSLRFKLLLKDYKLPLKELLMLNFLSQFLSFMIPVRLGEITKGVYLNSTFDLPLGKTLVWVFIDRFLDFWVVLFLASTLFLIVPTNLPADIRGLVLLLLVIFTLFSILMVTSQNSFKKIVTFLSNFLIVGNIKRWFVSFTHTIIDGFEILRQSPAHLITLLALTITATLAEGLIWFFIFLSLGVQFGFSKAVMGNVLNALTFLAPAAPGYVGSVEAASLAIFSGVLGLDANLSSAASILFHILTLIALPVFGVTSLYFLKFDLNLVWKKLRRE